VRPTQAPARISFIGFRDAPHIYVDKLVELTDVADYIGKRYGGWLALAQKYGKKAKSNSWIGLPSAPAADAGLSQVCPQIGRLRSGAGRPCRLPRSLQEAAGGRQAGPASRSATPSATANGFANWLLWSHNAALLDERATSSQQQGNHRRA